MADEERTGWRSRCVSDANCIEVALDDQVMVRDTKDRRGGTLVFDHAAWRRFIDEVRRG